MRLAAARAGLWFFGTVIAIFILGSDTWKKESVSTGEMIGTLAFFATVVAGVVFFYTWHEYEQKERELRDAERRKALEDSNDTSKTP